MSLAPRATAADDDAAARRKGLKPPRPFTPKEVHPNDNSPLGINVAAWTYYTSDLAFIDLMKGCSGWGGHQASQSWVQLNPLATDANGYPVSLLPDQLASTILARNLEGRFKGGRYVCLYDGKGELEFRFAAKVVAAEPGKIVVNVDPNINGGIGMQITAVDQADPIRNIRLVHEDDMAAYKEGKIFKDDFLSRWKKYKVIRFMEWQQINHSQVIRWSDRTTPAHAMQTRPQGVSLEHMIDLCIALNADGWFCIPHQADDDYVRQFTTMLRDRMPPHLKIYIEYSNELWNYGFEQSTWAAQQAIATGLTPTANENSLTARLLWTAYRSKQIFEIVEQVMGSGLDRVVRVIATQAAGLHTARTILDYQDTAAHVDAIAIAPYFYVDVEPATLVDATVDAILDSAQRGMRTQTFSWITDYQAEMNKRNKKLICYEAGQHLAARNVEAVWPKFIEANRHPRMGELYDEYLKEWKARAGGMCVLFDSAGIPNRYGSWGLLEYGLQDPATAPKYLSADRFIDANRTSTGFPRQPPKKGKRLSGLESGQ
jgi:hypothetical protein